MANLDDFLAAEDLDDLIPTRGLLHELTEEDENRIRGVFASGKDGQKVSNLLFHPDLIPLPTRFEAIDEALQSYDHPFIALAATVGLQSLPPESVPETYRHKWAQYLLAMVRTDAGVLSSRASVTLCSWIGEDWKRLIRSFPVPDETASNNIVAFAVSRFGGLPKREFIQVLKDCGIGFWDRRQFIKKYKEGASGPLYSYIPNYRDVEKSPLT